MSAGTLAGCSALVTGASGDIGREIAVALAEAGADVGLVARRETALRETAETVRGLGRRAAVAVADVTDEDQVLAAVELVEKELDGIDVVVNNAGGARFLAPLLETERRGWDKTVALNLTAPYLVAKAAVPGMIRRGRGSVVNIGSLVGLRAQEGMAFYSAAKSGLLMLTRSMAKEWGPRGIRANAVVPGLIETEGWAAYEGQDAMAALKTDHVIPLGRWGRARDVAGPVVFLASEAAAYVTGAALTVDGGATA
ncbi:SDR family oxidoreductase [Amycolatopsis sp. K13G38]|uniref:SDR family oxidoreductase n=1 Tax=Amycolatopsis acididurans TaxID=2724524 RepID=A0ABX1JFD8_9PSEU|nr:SDR family NAD(P)-dependent oxidoreductase [Amycolatopsis acididurans]NKQ57226.1 SDR family oxidoreductase [Amycolatopsis acididurans]